MSGGSFNYAYCKVDQFSDELSVRLDEHDRKNEYGHTLYSFEQATREKLREISEMARYVADIMKEVEWLYSGDTSEDSFMDRVREIESSNVRKQQGQSV